MRSISICSWQEPFPHTSGVAVVFDIFRCSTTIQCLYNRKPSNLWVAPSLKQLRETNPLLVKNYSIFSELSQPIDCAARFDNSPEQVMNLKNPPESALVATTTGTPAMFAAKDFEEVYVGSLVGFSALIELLAKDPRNITLIPAAFNTSNHVEDGIVAQSVATALEGYYTHKAFVDSCAEQARAQIIASGRQSFLTEKLTTGARDTEIALQIDLYKSTPKLQFTENPLLAKIL